MKIAFVLLLLLAICGSSTAQQCTINLSSRDCVACVSNLKTLIKTFPEAKIVLDVNEIEDSTDIMDKFGLSVYRKNIEWGATATQASAYPVSWVSIEKDKEVVFRDTLKSLDFNTLASVLNKGHQADSCPRKLPTAQRLVVSGKNVFLEHLQYSRFYLYHSEQDSVVEYKLTSELTNQLYDILKWSKAQREFYAALHEREPTFKPKYVTAYYLEDTLHAVAQVLVLDEIVGTDSFYNKEFAVLSAVNHEPKIIGFIDPSSLPKPYYYEESSLIYRNGRYFIGVDMPSDDALKRNPRDTFHKLAELTLSEGKLRFHQFLPLHLPSYMLDYKIGYNMSNLHSANGLISHAFSNVIYNMNNNAYVVIPYEQRVIASISNFMSELSLNFYLEDFVWNATTDLYTILYVQDGTYFVASFKRGDKAFRSAIPFTQQSNYLEKYNAVSLSQDGRSLILLTKPNRCLISYHLNSN